MKVESGRLKALVGSSRSGKSVECQDNIKKFDRQLIWDIKGEYPVQHRAHTRAELANLIKTLKGKPGKIAFTYGENISLEKAFDFFCRVAQSWVKSHYVAGKNCALAFEETADVTNPGKAPDAYGVILRQYLGYGAFIFAITQRPAESDKTAIGNASQVHICRLQRHDDRVSVSKDTGVPLSVIEGLRADQDKKVFDYVRVDTGRGLYKGGKLTFPSNKAKFTDEKEEKPL